MNAFAYDFEKDGIYYNIIAQRAKKVEVTYNTYWNTDTYTGTVAIPETVTYNNINYIVTSIGESAFGNSISLSSVIIPNSITSIGNNSFTLCSSMTSITIPNNVTSIGEGAFNACSSLAKITVEVGNTVYDSREDCNAIIETATNTLIRGCKNTVIPNSVTTIGEKAWSGSGLTSITIPDNVTSIGNGAFINNSLAKITVESGNAVYDSREDCNAIIETATNTLICGCQTTIIPNSVLSIGSSAFYNCSRLTNITIPNEVIAIEEGAFFSCSSMTSITIPGKVTTIGEGAFAGCSNLAKITVEVGNTVYDSREDCNAIIETATNTLICGCKNTIIPNSVTSIGNKSFYQCEDLTSIVIPNNVTSIGSFAFYLCTRLTSVIIPNSVIDIMNSAFSYCDGLTCVTIPNSVTSIGWYAFWYCNNLQSVTSMNTTPPTCGSFVFSNAESCTLYVSAESASLYQIADTWKDFYNIVGKDFSGVEEALSDVDANAEYYNLQGMKVATPEKGIYVKVQNGKATKVVL